MREKDLLNRRIRKGSGGNRDADELAQKLSQAVHEAFDAVEGEPGKGAPARSAQTAVGESRNAGEAVELLEGTRNLPGFSQNAAQIRSDEPEMVNATVQKTEQGDNPKTLEDDKMPVVRARFPRWKRWLDVTCIVLTIPFWLPLMIFAVLMIKIVSRGPVFFRQRRVGLGGTHFMILKFRSMQVNAETGTHERYFQQLMQADCPMTKLDLSGDARLIPGGRLLRATALDELPQILNVLRGEMSLVGPRPCTPSEYERYQARHKLRIQFPPGLTGYWQVSGKNKTTFNEMIEMDLHYGKSISAALDISIMLKTFPALIEQVWESQAKRRLEKKAFGEHVAQFETIKERTN
jgi:lipopolysaccharide/colanic/teichoic acid biosynthesis glycosyltransferase